MSPDALAVGAVDPSAKAPTAPQAAKALLRYPVRGGSAWAWFLAAAAAGIGGYSLVPGGLPRDVLYLCYGLTATAAIEAGVLLNRPAHARPWHLLALGTLLWSAADGLGAWYSDVLDDDTFPTTADPVYLVGYLVVAAGLVLLCRGRRRRREPAALLDSAIVTVALGLLVWVLLARPTMAGHSGSALAATVAAAYPLLDILLVGLLFRLVTTPGGRSWSFRLLVLAVALLALADTLVTALYLTTWDAGGDLDVLWLVSYAATGAAALHPSMVSMTEPVAPEPVRFSRLRLATLAVAAMVAPGVLAVEAVLGVELDVWAVVVGSVGVFGLVVARMKLSLDQIQTANAERETARLALAHQAAHDSLTGLPNRAQLLYLIRGALGRAQRSSAVVGVLFIDLDGFKQVNDTLGHGAGDEVLVTCGRRMQACVRTGDVVARFGGDEFVVLLEPLDEEASAVGVADRLIAALSEPMVLRSGREVSVGASVGVAIAQDGGVDPERLLDEADVAVLRAKAGGRGRSEVFDVSLRAEIDRRQHVQAGLVRAIEDGDLELRHEPVVDLRTQRLAGYEAKVSWPRAGEDELGRDDVVPVAVRTDLVCDLDTWALRTAAQQAACIPAGYELSMLEVPLSGRHLRGTRVVADVLRALEAVELDPGRLVLVVAAADLVDDLAVTTHLSRLRDAGVRVCVEGFGTHEGPTDRWAGLPVDLVRVDAHALARGPLRTSMLLRLTVETAHTFGWEVVASGVSDADEVATLTEVGCDYAQGPIPRRTIAALSGSRSSAA